MIFRWDFIGKGRFCLYLWAQVYCLSGRATVLADLPVMVAALQVADTVHDLASHGPPLAYSQGAPTVYSPRSSPAHSQGVTCAFTGHAACAATLGRPRAPQLPRAQAPGSRPCAATARRPWAPECRQAPVLCLACPAARGPQWGGPTPLGWQWVGLALLWVVQGPTTPSGLRWAAARWWAGQWVRPLGWPWVHHLG